MTMSTKKSHKDHIESNEVMFGIGRSRQGLGTIAESADLGRVNSEQ